MGPTPPGQFGNIWTEMPGPGPEKTAIVLPNGSTLVNWDKVNSHLLEHLPAAPDDLADGTRVQNLILLQPLLIVLPVIILSIE